MKRIWKKIAGTTINLKRRREEVERHVTHEQLIVGQFLNPVFIRDRTKTLITHCGSLSNLSVTFYQNSIKKLWTVMPNIVSLLHKVNTSMSCSLSSLGSSFLCSIHHLIISCPLSSRNQTTISFLSTILLWHDSSLPCLFSHSCLITSSIPFLFPEPLTTHPKGHYISGLFIELSHAWVTNDLLSRLFL